MPELIGGVLARSTVMKKPMRMRESTKKKILAVLEEAFKVAGLTLDFEFAIVALKILKKHSPKYDLTRIIVGGVWAGVARTLDDAPEPGEDDFKKICEEIKNVPYAIKKSVATEFGAVVQQLPHPKGGRPRSLTETQIMEVRYKLGQLDAEGIERADILKRVAAEYRVSVRTIQRAWQTRKVR